MELEQWLEHYRIWGREIMLLRTEIKLLEQQKEYYSDVVTGSQDCFPFVSKTITVTGSGISAADRAKILNRKQRIQKLADQRAQIEAFVEESESSEMRQILFLRYIRVGHRMTFQQIAFAIGRTDEQWPRKKLKKFLSETKKTKNQC